MDDRALFRYPPDYRVGELKTALDWSAYPGAGGGFQGAVEMCNNNGACRKLEGGVMCPSYRATRNEKDVTRGRANTLRLAISGQLGPDALASDEMVDTLKLCVSCKACRHECPTGVDMAKMKIEVLAARAAKHGLSLRDRLVGFLPHYAALASRSGAARQSAQQQPVAAQAVRKSRRHQRAARAARDGGAMCSGPTSRRSARPMAAKSCCSPTPSTAPMSAKISTPRCACWSRADTASICQSPPTAAGRYAAGGRFSRPAWSITPAAELDRLVATYAPFAARGVPIVGLEPSCLLTLRDELLSLRSDDTAKNISAHALLFEEFLVREAEAGRLRLPLGPVADKAVVHGHCHQKSFGAFKPVEQVLRLVPDLNVETIESSCCGMAGAFGYGADTYQTSIEMAETIAAAGGAARRRRDA